MKVVVYSRTPLAASPWELYKALKRYTLLDVTLINEVAHYADGRSFPYHVLMNENGSMNALRQADVWHVHNYLTPVLIRSRGDQKVVAQFHSLPRLGNWRQLIAFADARYTIAQPLQEKEYCYPSLPNIIDPDEYFPQRRGEKVRIAFAPTTRARIGRPDSKGYHEVRHVLDHVARERDVEIVWVEGKPYEENLRLKSSAHILIDDVVTGNWHRTSLEGACFGCAVINRVQKNPFVHANLETLREKLLWLIDDKASLRFIQERSRLWALREWHAVDKVKAYVKAYEEVLNGR